jgi:hypothetical protein
MIKKPGQKKKNAYNSRQSKMRAGLIYWKFADRNSAVFKRYF